MVFRARAVLFDLFNTLIPGGSGAERDRVSRLMAAALSVDPDDLAVLIRATFDDRTRGLAGDLHETIAWLAGRLGAQPSEAEVEVAAELRLEMTRNLHRNTWALPVLRELGAAGVRRGLVSDCSAETPAIWGLSPLAPHFEAVSFSCVTGHRKPEPEAYLNAVRQLGVAAEDCLYVGDGGSFELSGAEALGMTAIRFLPPNVNAGESIDDDDEWSGRSTADLTDLLAHV